MLKKALRRTGVVVALFLLLLTAVAAIVLSTESGTRWTLRQAMRFAPGELVVNEFRGTFLHGLEIPRLSYRNAMLEITATDLEIRMDWLRSSLNRVHLTRLAADEITYRSLTAPDPEVRPLEISMPVLPIRIGAESVSIRSLLIGDIAITDIAAAQIDVRGTRITVDSGAAEVAGVAATIRMLDATLNGDVPVSATVHWRYADGTWSGDGRVHGTLAELAFEHELSGEYPASAEGKAILLHRVEPEVDAVVRFDRWIFGPIVASKGEVQVSGTSNAYRATVKGELSKELSLSATLAGEVTGNRSGLDSLEVTATGAAGRLTARGQLDWLPGFSTELEVHGEELDPSQVSALATGKLNTDLRLKATSANDFEMQIASLEGTYNDARALAHGSLLRNADLWRCTGCDLSLGPNHILLDGELTSDRLAAKLDVTAPNLRLFWPELSGAVTADIQVRGKLALPEFSGEAAGENVEWTSWSAGSFSVVSRASTAEKVDLDISVDALRHGESLFGGGTASLSGKTSAVDADLKWRYQEADAAVLASLAMQGDAFAANVRTASFTEPFAGTWQLSEPVRFSLSPESMNASAHEWTNGEARLNVAKLSVTGGQMAVEASLVAVPLATLNIALPPNVRLSGYADGELRLSQAPDGARTGELRWNQRETVVRISPPSDEPIDISVPVASAEVSLVAAGFAGQARLEVESGVTGSLEFSGDSLSADSAITARLLFSGEEWSWIPAFFPQIDNFEGTIATNISASGSLAAPELRGELRWQQGSLAVPALNISLEQIEVAVAGSSAGSATVAGTATSGGGTLAIDGRLDDLTRSDRSFTFNLGGQQAMLLNWPDYQLVATPDLVFTGGEAGIKASGKINVDRAEISVSELPEEAVSPSGDVTVIGRKKEVRETIPLSGKVDMILSENVHINAFGLDSKVEGELEFTLREGRDPRANGELKLVDGVFTAYGQRLTIDEGTLTFNGPLDNPVIFVRAVRTIDSLSGTIKAGIELRGRAQNLSSSVFSSPTMSEADALSYLILGRPLEDASAADGSMLSGTAFALGLRQATAITNQIGQTLGLDQLAVAGSNQSTTALVAGKQINSRLYVRYAYGVFSQIGNLLLRYKLSKRLTIEAGTGESQSMDLLYLVEKP
jgi:translocation and assembly module TamB